MITAEYLVNNPSTSITSFQERSDLFDFLLPPTNPYILTASKINKKIKFHILQQNTVASIFSADWQEHIKLFSFHILNENDSPSTPQKKKRTASELVQATEIRNRFAFHLVDNISLTDTDLTVLAHFLSYPEISSDQITYLNLSYYLPRFETSKDLYRFLKTLPQLSSITASYSHLADPHIELIAKLFPDLIEIDLSGCDRVTNNAIKTMCVFTNLQTLELKHCSQLTANTLSLPDQFPSITALTVSGCEIIGEKTIRDFAYYHNLLELNISRLNQISNPLVIEIACRCSHLIKVNLIGCRNVNNSGIQAILNTCKKLRSIGFSAWGQINSYLLEPLTPCPNLTELILGDCNEITYYAFDFISPKFPCIKTLNLAMCTVQDLMVIEIAKRLPGLTALDLSWAWKLTDEAIAAVALECKELRSLNLHHCSQITDAALEALCQSPGLHWINVTQCRFVTQRGITQLKLSHSGLTVLNSIVS